MMSLPLERVILVKEMNKRGQFPEQLPDPNDLAAQEEELDFADVTGDIELPDYKRKRKKKKKKPQHPSSPSSPGQDKKSDSKQHVRAEGKKHPSPHPHPSGRNEGEQKGAGAKRRKNRNKNRGKKPGGGPAPQNNPGS